MNWNKNIDKITPDMDETGNTVHTAPAPRITRATLPVVQGAPKTLRYTKRTRGLDCGKGADCPHARQPSPSAIGAPDRPARCGCNFIGSKGAGYLERKANGEIVYHMPRYAPAPFNPRSAANNPKPRTETRDKAFNRSIGV